jgi:hypothetical protein
VTTDPPNHSSLPGLFPLLLLLLMESIAAVSVSPEADPLL